MKYELKQNWKFNYKEDNNKWYEVDLVLNAYKNEKLSKYLEIHDLFIDVECEPSYCQYSGKLIDEIPVYAQVVNQAGLIEHMEYEGDDCFEKCVEWIKKNSETEIDLYV